MFSYCNTCFSLRVASALLVDLSSSPRSRAQNHVCELCGDDVESITYLTSLLDSSLATTYVSVAPCLFQQVRESPMLIA